MQERLGLRILTYAALTRQGSRTRNGQVGHLELTKQALQVQALQFSLRQ
ncbi:hypothetical protein L1047_07925 [Synechococcus sp. Nb3U1]|nr:hypothetical protein [Synechococcus sp. Nb3U1]MCF2971119.1 hypothetical protein [Synechococcus sp. Nb3U1]